MKLLRPRYSLRALLLLVLVFCAALGYLANEAHDNERLIARAGRQFAVVEFDEWGPGWLRNWVGARYFREPVALYVPRDFAENCLPLLEEYPSIKTLGVEDTARFTTNVDWSDLQSQVEAIRSGVHIFGVNHFDNWRSVRVKPFDKSAPECRQLASLINQASRTRRMMREGFDFQTFAVPVANEELQLWLLQGEISAILLARGDQLIDCVAVGFFGKNVKNPLVPVAVDADADGSLDVGFYWFDYPNSRGYADNFHRVSPAGLESVPRNELCEKYRELTTLKFRQY